MAQAPDVDSASKMLSARAPLTATSTNAAPRVLLAEDEPGLLHALVRVLAGAGYEVTAVPDGDAAIESLGRNRYAVVITDIIMPGADGMAVLRTARGVDADVPVVLMTGGPTLRTAMEAIELGAWRYLVKPVDMRELLSTVARAVQLRRLADLKRQALQLFDEARVQESDLATLRANFDRAVGTLWMAFQPIISWQTRTLFGHEALVRTGDRALPHPGALFDAAERLQRVHSLGRAIRERTASDVEGRPEVGTLFINLHPRDLLDEQLYATGAPLSTIAQRVVLEITERASLDGVPDVRSRINRLKEMGFRIALDDLGAGYAGLSSFTLLEPEVVKLDMSLVRELHLDAKKRKIVESMLHLCTEMGSVVVAEGIETAEERDVLASLGCELLQGFLFARPAPPFPEVTW